MLASPGSEHQGTEAAPLPAVVGLVVLHDGSVGRTAWASRPSAGRATVDARAAHAGAGFKRRPQGRCLWPHRYRQIADVTRGSLPACDVTPGWRCCLGSDPEACSYRAHETASARVESDGAHNCRLSARVSKYVVLIDQIDPRTRAPARPRFTFHSRPDHCAFSDGSVSDPYSCGLYSRGESHADREYLMIGSC